MWSRVVGHFSVSDSRCLCNDTWHVFSFCVGNISFLNKDSFSFNIENAALKGTLNVNSKISLGLNIASQCFSDFMGLHIVAQISSVSFYRNLRVIKWVLSALTSS